MRNAATILCITVILLFSCNKLEDKIVYKKLNPSSYTEPIKYTSQFPSFPIDLDTSFTFDVDGDGVNDVTFRYLSEMTWPPGGNYYTEYLMNKKITAEGIDDNFLISSEKENDYCEKYVFNDKIKRGSNYKQSVTIYSEWFNGETWNIPYNNFKGENYLAFKLKGKYYGWFKIKCFSPGEHEFEVVEYAYNTNPKNSILAGQTE